MSDCSDKPMCPELARLSPSPDAQLQSDSIAVAQEIMALLQYSIVINDWFVEIQIFHDANI